MYAPVPVVEVARTRSAMRDARAVSKWALERPKRERPAQSLENPALLCAHGHGAVRDRLHVCVVALPPAIAAARNSGWTVWPLVATCGTGDSGSASACKQRNATSDRAATAASVVRHACVCVRIVHCLKARHHEMTAPRTLSCAHRWHAVRA